MRRFFKVKIWLRYVDKRVGLPQKPQEPRLFGPEPTTSARERPAVSSFRRRRRLRPGGDAPRPSRARLCAPTNASPSRPDPPTLIRRRLVDSDRRRPRQAALQRRKTAEKRLKETGKALLPREAAHRRQQGRSTRRSGPARPIPGRAGAVPLARSACVQPAPSQMRVGERGAGGLGADLAAGAVGSRAECAAGRRCQELGLETASAGRRSRGEEKASRILQGSHHHRPRRLRPCQGHLLPQRWPA